MAKILVTQNNLAEAYDDLMANDKIGLDTETYGLNIYLHMFALQLATEKNSYYFNFHDYEGGRAYVWDREDLLQELKALFNRPEVTWFIHNAKFDLHRLLNCMVTIRGRVHCTQAIERINYNQYRAYGLDACLRRRGLEKNKEVEEYISRNKIFEWITVEGKKKRIKDKHYYKVPFDIMFRYGCDDAEHHRLLGIDQLPKVYDWDLYESECELVKTCMEIERRGICIDKDYIKKGIEHESKLLRKAVAKATMEAQEEYVSGPKWLRRAFDRVGQSYDVNEETGNPIFDKSALGKMQSPLAETIKEIRRSEKYVGTYYSSFNYYGGDGYINANIKQSGTDTGRFSYSEPNLQNVPKEEDFNAGEVQVRKCFVPREDHVFVMIDFDQQEYRLMLDYAGETELIKNIMDNGLDIHQATADLVGVSRKDAKTLNFGLLYGMGREALASSLKITEAEARSLMNKYFSKLPKVGKLIDDIKHTAKSRGYVTTWAGRRLNFPQREFSYKAPNHLIQGGCGDIARRAMNELAKIKAPMLVQVHDEILFEVHKDRLEEVPVYQKVMEDIYKPINGMKLTCGVEHSWISWGKQDVIGGLPCQKKEQE